MLNKTSIVLIEVLDEKKFKEKYQRVIDILEKNYNFNKTEKNMVPGTLSNMKAWIYYLKINGEVAEWLGARLER